MVSTNGPSVTAWPASRTEVAVAVGCRVVVEMKQATALPPGTLDVVVKVGQLTGNTLPQAVETTHELGESAGGADG